MITAGFIEATYAQYLIVYWLLALTPGAGLLLFTSFPRPLEVATATPSPCLAALPPTAPTFPFHSPFARP